MYLLKKGFQERKMNTIGKMAKKMPNDFWKAIKKLMNQTKEKHNNAISPKIWNAYFEKLLNTQNKPNYDKFDLIQNEIDKPITTEEIITELKSCKNNKAGSSSITFEMIKSDPIVLAPYLRHLYNLVLTNNTLPKLWNISPLGPDFQSWATRRPLKLPRHSSW